MRLQVPKLRQQTFEIGEVFICIRNVLTRMCEIHQEVLVYFIQSSLRVGDWSQPIILARLNVRLRARRFGKRLLE